MQDEDHTAIPRPLISHEQDCRLYRMASWALMQAGAGTTSPPKQHPKARPPVARKLGHPLNRFNV